MNTIQVTRTGNILKPNPARVLLRPFFPGDEKRVSGIIARVLALSEERADALLAEVCAEFAERHHELRRSFLERFEQVRKMLPPGADPSENRRLLIGAYLLAEYSVESAALFNPSLLPHPDQAGVAPGALRFILSLRATGEGHISSITFRTGTIHANGRIEVDTPSGLLAEPRRTPNAIYEAPLFSRKLQEMGLADDFTRRVMGALGETFALPELREAINAKLQEERYGGGVLDEDQSTAEAIWTLAQSNFEVRFEQGREISERILFPATPTQTNGIEDARFVCFYDNDGSRIYYATFTAFDGRAIVPELVETTDFLCFQFLSLNGPAAQNKGMALFPRKIGGRYAMLSRQDNESIFIMFSDNVHFWNEQKLLLQPAFPWELVQLGNCGSPLETDAGWLVLSHGVGPMRKYCIGAFLLDREDPTKVIGRLHEPLLQPNAGEREGYVPNVVYSCGALIHNGMLILPYGLADQAAGFATVPVDELLTAIERET